MVARTAAIALASLLIVVALSAQAKPEVSFSNIAASAGLTFRHINGASSEKFLPETMGGGGLFFDFDNDGWPDVFLVDSGSLADDAVARRARHRLYRNRRDGTFDDVTARSGIVHRGYGMGACAGDYDNDGAIDLYVTAFGANTLYRGDGRGVFTDVTSTAAVAAGGWSSSCAFADVDRDGDLDLFVARYLDWVPSANRFCGDAVRRVRAYCHPSVYAAQSNLFFRNDGGGRFTEATRTAGLLTKGKGLGVVFGDYNADGAPDLLVANDAVPNALFQNDGRGTFTEVGLLAGVAVAADGKARAGMGVDMEDFDGDGRPDVVVTNLDLEMHSVFRNLGRGLFEDVTAASGVGPATLPYVGFGTAWVDYDNDGALDLAIVNGNVMDNPAQFRPGATYAQRKLLFRNDGRGRFREVGLNAGPGLAAPKVGRTLAVADIDNDGDLDFLVTGNGQAVELLRNDGGHQQHSLLVRAIGTRSNRSGVGALLRVVHAGGTATRTVKAGSSYLGQHDLRLHVGLGTSTRAELLELRWPSGQVDTVRDVLVNQIVTVVEGRGVTERVEFAARSTKND